MLHQLRYASAAKSSWLLAVQPLPPAEAPEASVCTVKLGTPRCPLKGPLEGDNIHIYTYRESDR